MTHHDWNRLAQIASYGSVDFRDAYGHSGTTVSKTQRKREARFKRQLERLERAGYVTITFPLTLEAKPTDAGVAALLERGYVKGACGYYLVPGAPLPSWAQ